MGFEHLSTSGLGKFNILPYPKKTGCNWQNHTDTAHRLMTADLYKQELQE